MALQQPESAYGHSRQVYDIEPEKTSVQLIRGATLIEKGMLTGGIEMLGKIVGLELGDGFSLSGAIFLFYGLHQQKKPEEAKKYHAHITANKTALQAPDKFFWHFVNKQLR